MRGRGRKGRGPGWGGGPVGGKRQGGWKQDNGGWGREGKLCWVLQQRQLLVVYDLGGGRGHGRKANGRISIRGRGRRASMGKVRG